MCEGVGSRDRLFCGVYVSVNMFVWRVRSGWREREHARYMDLNSHLHMHLSAFDRPDS